MGPVQATRCSRASRPETDPSWRRKEWSFRGVEGVALGGHGCGCHGRAEGVGLRTGPLGHRREGSPPGTVSWGCHRAGGTPTVARDLGPGPSWRRGPRPGAADCGVFLPCGRPSGQRDSSLTFVPLAPVPEPPRSPGWTPGRPAVFWSGWSPVPTHPLQRRLPTTDTLPTFRFAGDPATCVQVPAHRSNRGARSPELLRASVSPEPWRGAQAARVCRPRPPARALAPGGPCVTT